MTRADVPAGIFNACDYETLARTRLDPAHLAHLEGGSGGEVTLRANRHGFERIGLEPRLLRDVRGGGTERRVLGQALRHPILLAPVAYQRLFHPDGELAWARGAEASDSGIVLSTLASFALEAVAAHGPSPRWFQLYLQPRREDSIALVRRAEDAGYAALVVTLDTPIQSPPRRALQLGFRLPPDVIAANLRDARSAPERRPDPRASRVFDAAMAHAPRCEDLDWLMQQTPLPLLAKGVTHADDAEMLCAMGVRGLVVSNHGGRALDGAPATIDRIAPIRRRVGPGVALLLDGGIRSGGDVFKALALGADAVLVGRLAMHALAVAGDLGVAHLMRLLREELEMTMALCGCARLADIDAACIRPDPATPASVAHRDSNQEGGRC